MCKIITKPSSVYTVKNENEDKISWTEINVHIVKAAYCKLNYKIKILHDGNMYSTLFHVCIDCVTTKQWILKSQKRWQKAVEVEI